ncbi:MAG: FAD-binding oxidoreductase [Paracoccaceae bacterium]|nr:FAD-binding oxidoreductase [Paracoccaceae bacterium]
MAATPHVAVVGAGIVGSAIALELARRGAQVTQIDAGGRRASENSFGWINATWLNRDDYFRLRHFSMGVWRALEGRVPGLAPRWVPSLLWDLEEGPLRNYVSGRGAMGYGLRLLERDEIARLEPGLAVPPPLAALGEEEGYIDAGLAAEALRKAAAAEGVRPVAEEAVSVGPGTVRLKGGDLVTAGAVVVAAGRGTGTLTGLPVDEVPGLMVLTTPLRARISHMLAPPELLVRQDDQGRVLCGGEAGGSRIDRDGDAIAADLVERVRGLFGERDIGLERVIIGYRPVPADEHPAIGPLPDLPGVYAAVMHSGVTLAPGVAQLMADEILDGTDSELLGPFRPARLL